MSTYLTEETLRGLVYDLQQALSDKNTEQALEILLSLSSSSVSATVLAKTQAPIVFKRLRGEAKLPVSIRTKCRDLIRKWKQEARRELVKKPEPKDTSSSTEEEQDPRAELIRRLTASDTIARSNVYDVVEYEYDDQVGFNKERVTTLRKGDKKATGPVIYWMQRDQRLMDNWALIHAQRRAARKEEPLIVLFAIPPPSSLGPTTARAYGFMLRGLRQLEQDLRSFNIMFRLVQGDPKESVAQYANSVGASAMVMDFSPLKVVRDWKDAVVQKAEENIVIEEVDAHNIVPTWAASNQAEVSVRLLRKKIRAGLGDFLTDFPHVMEHPYQLDTEVENRCIIAPRGDISQPGVVVKNNGESKEFPWTDWQAVVDKLDIDFTVPEVKYCVPGERGAALMLDKFLHEKVKSYADKRDDPNKPAALSGLSAHLNHGHISSQRIILEIVRVHETSTDLLFVLKQEERTEGVQVFADEVTVHKEIGDNFCLYTPSYDTIDGFPDWARQSLEEHSNDPRPDVQEMEALEKGNTTDQLWNAAQKEMVTRGKMHPVMRQYWAKKLLEFCSSPETAFETAIFLNDKYSVDGRDPLSVTGCANAIGALHEMGSKEKEIYGKVRNMASSACESKFHVKTYVETHNK